MSHMNKSNPGYCALRFRSTDHLHRKGDIKYVAENVIYIGQTDECGLRIACHPEYEDCCYAVMVKDENGTEWKIIRQEPTADISVNGIPLSLIGSLHDGDLLKFDRTIVQFTEGKGEIPGVSYIQSRTPWGMWIVLTTMILIITGIVLFLHDNNKKPIVLFKDEISSICKVEADTLLVLSSMQDTLDVIVADHPFIGTGFITDEGYFVTARHCVEFWLAMEEELRSNFHDIQSSIVRKAIDAEMDTTIRLVAKVKIVSNDGKNNWYFSSDDFTMDKTRDDIYECGDFMTPYLWRSVMSRFEKRDAELGDVAVMKWVYGEGNVHLGSLDSKPEAGTKLYGFGFPYSENRQEVVFSYSEGQVFHQPLTARDCFLCDKGFDPGFSGAPVFTRDSEKTVVGIITRMDGQHTLIVPVSQIRFLFNKIQEK